LEFARAVQEHDGDIADDMRRDLLQVSRIHLLRAATGKAEYEKHIIETTDSFFMGPISLE